MALHHASPGEVIDLDLPAQTADTPGTRAIVKTDRFEAIRLVLEQGDAIPAHQVASQITLHCLEGTANVKLADRTLPCIPINGCSLPPTPSTASMPSLTPCC